MGVDLGINYHVTSVLTFSMSMIDLGKINWKSNVNSRDLNKEFPPLPPLSYLPPITQGGVQTIKKTENDPYFNKFDFRTFYDDYTTFSKPLPTSLYAGIKYQLNPGLSIDITDKFVAAKNLSYNSLATTATFDINKKLSICTGYLMIADALFNIPFALLYQGNFGQVFLGTDNLTSMVFPSSAEFAGISFGACFYLFTHRNLSQDAPDNTPFYKPRKIIKNPKTGLIMNEDSNYQ